MTRPRDRGDAERRSLAVGDRGGAQHRSVAVGDRDVALVDLIDRLLAGGVVIAGDITLAVADVDLVYVSLRALVSSVATAEEQGFLPPMGDALAKDALAKDALGKDALAKDAL